MKTPFTSGDFVGKRRNRSREAIDEKTDYRAGDGERHPKKCMAPPPESTVERINLASGGTNAANVSGFCFVKALRLRALMESAP